MDGTDVVDISGATTKEMIFTEADGTTAVQTAEFSADGTDGRLAYTTRSGDLSTAGELRVQVYLAFTDGTSWRTNIETLQVYDNLPCPL